MPHTLTKFYRYFLAALCGVAVSCTRPGNPVPGGDAEAIHGRTEQFFFQRDPHYRCTGSDGIEIAPGYSSSILVSETQDVFLLGDKCHPTRERIESSQIEVSTQKDILGYEKGIFELSPPNAIPEIYAVAWCTPLSSLDRELVFQSDGQARYYVMGDEPSAWIFPYSTSDILTGVIDHAIAGLTLYQLQGGAASWSGYILDTRAPSLSDPNKFDAYTNTKAGLASKNPVLRCRVH